jgi:hypothetical protein
MKPWLLRLDHRQLRASPRPDSECAHLISRCASLLSVSVQKSNLSIVASPLRGHSYIASIARGNLHDLRCCHACVGKVSFRKSGMNLEHQAGLAKFPRHWMAARRPHRFRKSLFQIDLAAGARKTRNAFGADSFLNSVPVPALAQNAPAVCRRRIYSRNAKRCGRRNHSQGRNTGESLAQVCGVTAPLFDHIWQFPQQYAANRRLGLRESPICTKGFVEKSVSRGG